MTGAEYLVLTLERRRNKNSGYSLRAFARDLQVPVGRLSEILRRKRAISKKMAVHLIERLELSPREGLKTFGQQTADPKKTPDTAYSYDQIQEDAFQITADWYHFAILNLMDTEDFQHSPMWIGKRLGLEPSIVKFALDRLVRTQLLLFENGKYVKTGNNLATSDQIPSQTLRKVHQDVIQQGIEMMNLLPLSVRDISNVSMAIDTSNIPLAKAEIKRFRRRMARLLEKGKRTEVYSLNIQLVPITKPRGLVLT